MALFEWDDKFSVQIESIDNQHRELVQQINNLHDAMMEGRGQKEVEPIIKKLISYTDFHFKHEEELFDKFNYEGKQEHKAIHKNLIDQVVDLQAKVKAGEVPLSSDLMEFLKEWLMTHMLQEDKRYVTCLTANNVK